MTREVIIDGIRYAPVMESRPSMDAIARGLILSFWGVISHNATLEEAMQDVFVSVNDNGNGKPIKEVLDDISRMLEKP